MTSIRLRGLSRTLGFNPRRSKLASAGAAPYAATPVNFNGSTHLTRGGALTGVADSKVWSGSVWLRNADTANFAGFFQSVNSRSALLYGIAPGTWDLFGLTATAATTLRLQFTGFADTNWHHLLWSFDLADAGGRQAYLDDATVGIIWDTFNNNEIDFTDTDYAIGANDVAGNSTYEGDVADVWMRLGGAVIDFSVEANRRLFITAEGRPANPTGWPSGAQIQLHGAVDDWHIDKGGGGGFTEIGALGAGTGPVQLP